MKCTLYMYIDNVIVYYFIGMHALNFTYRRQASNISRGCDTVKILWTDVLKLIIANLKAQLCWVIGSYTVILGEGE